MKRLLIPVLFLYSVCAAADNTSERINGVAEFLIERANDNYLYLFQNSIDKNEKFKCYFPTTHASLVRGGPDALKRLLTSKETWRESIQMDLKILTLRSIVDQIDIGVDLSTETAKLAGQLIEPMQQLRLDYEGAEYQLTYVLLDAPEELKDLINGFYPPFGKAASVMGSLKKFGVDCDAGKEGVKEFDFDKFKLAYDEFYQFSTDIEVWIKHIEKNKNRLRLVPVDDSNACRILQLEAAACANREAYIARVEEKVNQLLKNELAAVFSEESRAKLTSIKTRIDALRSTSGDLYERLVYGAVCNAIDIAPADCSDQAINDWADGPITEENLNRILSPELLDSLNKLKEVKAVLEETQLTTVKRVEIALQDIRRLREEKIITGLSEQQLQKISNHIHFFAEVADAKTSDDVKAVLTNYTLPSVSFFEKRRSGDRFMITSYLGLVANIDEDDEVDEANDGIFAPVGLEYSRGGMGWGWFDSFSVMASPFDFGYPVNLKLSGTEDELEFDEVIAPSLTFALGVADYPATVGLGYQRGREIEDTGETEDRIILFIAFDMPLFNLYND